ncbi:unnamed protein product, partial [Adineta steineri]
MDFTKSQFETVLTSKHPLSKQSVTSFSNFVDQSEVPALYCWLFHRLNNHLLILSLHNQHLDTFLSAKQLSCNLHEYFINKFNSLQSTTINNYTTLAVIQCIMSTTVYHHLRIYCKQYLNDLGEESYLTNQEMQTLNFINQLKEFYTNETVLDLIDNDELRSNFVSACTLPLDPLVRMVRQGINSRNDENDNKLILDYPALRLLSKYSKINSFD